jgi:hypothetical protein
VIVVRARSVSAGRSDILGLAASRPGWRARHRHEFELLGLVLAVLVTMLVLAVVLGTPFSS